ncbi:MAG: hypothetical protein ABUL72_06430 [Armatimonadota bacterium]
MVTCSACGKLIDKVPTWLEGVNVAFICNNCPNRTIKGITEVSLAQTIAKDNATGALDEGFAGEEDDEDEEEA